VVLLDIAVSGVHVVLLDEAVVSPEAGDRVAALQLMPLTIFNGGGSVPLLELT